MWGINAFALAFNERSIIPSERFNWDDDDSARPMRYALAESFYNNTIYRDIESFSRVYRRSYALYKHTRGIYNPTYRQNELIKAKIAGGALDWDGLEKGALVVVGADDPLIQALIQGLKWSNWGVNKSLYVHLAALLGDVALKVVDDRRRGKVRLEVLHPAKIKTAEFDEVGNIKSVVIEYGREWTDPDTNKTKDVIYREEIDKTTFRTFKDKELFGWYTDANGNPMPEWDNEYGFVPLVIAQYKKLGRKWGANAFHAEAIKINEINDVASLLNDSVRKAIDPWWYLAGTTANTSLKAQGNLADGTATTDASAQRDKVKTLHGPENSQPYPMVFPVDIAGTGKIIQDKLLELERDMPELAIARLRESGGDKSGIAIRNAYSDATGRLNEGAANLDDALIRGLQMLVAIGGYRGYAEMGGFDLTSYEAGDLDFYIKEREFFEDGFTPQDRVSNLKSLPKTPEAARAVLEEMEYPADKIELIVAEITANAQQDAQQQAQFGQQGGAVNVQPNPRPALPAGQGNMQNSNAPGGIMTPEVMQQVNDLLASVGTAA